MNTQTNDIAADRNALGHGERRFRILVIDDDAAFRRLCDEYLHDYAPLRYEVHETETGADAVALCSAETFDCLLIDQNLPDSSGTALLRELRHFCGALTPMILLTGLGSEDIAIEALHSGAADYIPKERLSEKALGRAVSNAIEKSRLLQSIEERNQRLQRVNDELQRKNDQIQRFYHSVSHEIKTPLTAAREFVALVADGVFGHVSPEQTEALHYALESCDQIAAHFNELIESTRLETGKLRLEKAVYSIRKLVLLSVASVRTAIANKGIALEEVIEPNLPDIDVDGSRIVQVLANLLTNAEKFTDTGGHITIFAERSRSQDAVVLGVRDTGCGIAPDALPRIFDRLYQADTTPDSLSTRGLGLGLNIAQEIVALHGGEIFAQSAVGRGSTFRVHLPIGQGQPATDAAPP